MRVLDQHALARELAIQTKKYVLYLNWYNKDGSEVDVLELFKAAPYLNINEHGQALCEGCAVIVCENEEEAEELYWLTVGDDGPTVNNSYDGIARVYVLKIGPDGECLNENT